jgi:hypothetical protein
MSSINGVNGNEPVQRVPLRLLNPFLEVKTAFIAFLAVYARQPFLLNQAKPAIAALNELIGPLQKILGDKFLGLALGGSVVRNLWSPQTSDIDCYIYAQRIDQPLAEAAKQLADAHLRSRGLSPCANETVVLNDHVIALDQRPIGSPAYGLEVYADYFIYPENQEPLKAQAAASIKSIVDQGLMPKHLLLADLKEEFRFLTGSNPNQVVKKFLLNIASKSVGLNICNEILANDLCRDILVNIAAPYLAARSQVFPFPAEIEKLLS